MIDNRPNEELAFSDPVKLARTARIFRTAIERGRLRREAAAAKAETDAVPGGPNAA